METFRRPRRPGGTGGDGEGGGGKGNWTPPSTPHPENTCFGCVAIILSVVLGLAIWGYIYWRYNPEFHIETAGPGRSSAASPAR